MKKKLFFVVLLISDLVSTYKLLDAFPDSQTRIVGLASCLFFMNTLLILWMKYLIGQPAVVQKEIKFRILGSGVIDCSLYDILHNSWSKFRKFQILYPEIFFSLFVLILFLWIIIANIYSGNGNIFLLFANVYSSNLLLYYIGFCFGGISILTMALINNQRNGVIGSLRTEFVIKLIQTVFIAVLYGVGPIFPFIVLTSFLRLITRDNAKV